MTVTPDSLRGDLAGLSKQKASSDADGAKIREAGAKRRGEITARLTELAPRTSTDSAAAKEYQSLVAERGRIDQMGAGS